ncbi:GDP-mannose 4,6-dehydratase [Litorivicinus sp.]|nr:GDP-mannose 4,6-dehydratase [Litorivicinus sp.]
MDMRVVITGVSGQDGALLAKMLVEKGYEVHGFIRRGSLPKTPRTDYLNISKLISWHPVELTEFANVLAALKKIRPRYIYNLAAQSFVADSFLFPHLTNEINYVGYLNILESVRLLELNCRIYQASTSEMFGATAEQTLSEDSQFAPKSPYAVSKAASHYVGQNYREAYGMHISNGILFNHESELRGREFVTRKVTLQLCEIAVGKRRVLGLGNLDSVRDWGYAGDYVKAMELMVMQAVPDDYVVATNQIHTIRDLVRTAGKYVGFDIEFEGEGLREVGYDSKTGNLIVNVDPAYFRPSDVTYLKGDYSKIKRALGWEPLVGFDEMVRRMVEADQNRVCGEIHAF